MGVNFDLARGGKVCIAKGGEVALITGFGRAQRGFHQLREVVGAHVELDGTLERLGVDLDGVFHLAAKLGQILFQHRLQVLLERLHQRAHGGLDGGLQCGRDLRLERVGDLVGVAFQYSLQHAGNGLGQLALNGVGVHQIRHGFGQQLLELLRLQVGGKTPLFKVEDAVADDIVFVSLEHFLHKGLQGVRGDGEVQPGKGLAQVNVRQVLHPAQAVGQSVQIKLEIGCVYERGEIERPAAQVKSTVQIKVQGAGINGERVFEGVGIHREDRGKIQ